MFSFVYFKVLNAVNSVLSLSKKCTFVAATRNSFPVESRKEVGFRKALVGSERPTSLFVSLFVALLSVPKSVVRLASTLLLPSLTQFHCRRQTHTHTFRNPRSQLPSQFRRISLHTTLPSRLRSSFSSFCHPL